MFVRVAAAISIAVVMIAASPPALAEEATPDCAPYGIELTPDPELTRLSNCKKVNAAEVMCQRYTQDGFSESVVLFSSSTGKVRKFPLPRDHWSLAHYTPEGPVLADSTGTEVTLTNLITGAQKKLERPQKDDNGKFILDSSVVINGRSFFLGYDCPAVAGGCPSVNYEVIGNKLVENQSIRRPVADFGNLAVYDVSSLPGASDTPQPSSTPTGGRVVIDTLTGRTVAHLPGGGLLWVDQLGRKIIYADFPVVVVQDVETGKIDRLAGITTYCTLSDFMYLSDFEVLERCERGSFITNIKTGKSTRIGDAGETGRAWFGNYVETGSTGNFSRLTIKQACFNSGRYEIVPEPENKECAPQGEVLKVNEQENLSTKILCATPFDKELWDTAIPVPKSGKVSARDAIRFLQRFSKPGGFDPESHMQLLDAIIGSGVAVSNPGLAFSALSAAALQYPDAIMPLLKRRDSFLEDLAKRSGPKLESCQTEEEKRALQAKLIERVNKIAGPEYTSFGAAKFALLPHSSALKQLPEDSKEELMIALARANTRIAQQDNGYLKEVFSSELVVFSKKAFAPLFGGNPPPATDAMMVETPFGLAFIVIGSQPIEDVRKSGLWNRLVSRWRGDPPRTSSENGLYGFYYVGSQYIAKIEGVTEIEWRHDGKKYSSRFEVKRTKESDAWVPRDKAPRYDELWADGVLSGVVVLGANLAGEIADQTTDNFLSYYTDRDFEFSEIPEDVPDTKEYLKKKIVSGEFDYFVKQAHSDGDVRNLFSLPVQGKKLTGIRKLRGGREERIELLYPALNWFDRQPFPNQEFGQWIRDRKGGQLVYLNGSCNSYRKAREEIKATKSSKLLNIPTINNVVFFRDDPKDSGEYQFFDAFLDGKSFEEIRSAIKKSVEYKQGKTHYIFPDEDAYEGRVLIPMRGFEINTQVRDEKKNIYNFDARH